VFIADKIAAIRADHSCVNNQFFIVTYSAIEIIYFWNLNVFACFMELSKWNLKNRNKQFLYSSTRKKKKMFGFRLKVFFGKQGIDEFE